jgi:glucose-1-phosphate adenylyltransferase
MAGGSGTRLRPLTRWQSKPALPFGGQYRNIDFTLSNCVNSGLRRIAVLTQYKSHSLIRHVHRSLGFLNPELDEFCEMWPAQQRIGSGWYAGTADSVYQNIDLIDEIAPEHVLVLAGDHIYKMDYRPMIEAHVDSGAGVTIACTKVFLEQASNFGVMSIDRGRRITAFAEKPSRPQPLPDEPGMALGSMGIYVFERETLLSYLIRDAEDRDSRHDFGHDVLPRMIDRLDARAWPFTDERTTAPAYWRDVGTLDAYWQANMDLLARTPGIDLHDPAWPIRTHNPQSPPSQLLAGSRVESSIVASGCVVGGVVSRSVVFTGAHVAPGARIEDSLVLPGARIGRDCVVRHAIIDSDFVLEDGAVVDAGSPANAGECVSERGVTLMSRFASDCSCVPEQRSAA